MAVGKITKQSVDAMPVPSKGKREHLWDDTLKGFGLMVTDKGARSYILQYRIGGRGNDTRRVTIGKHGSPWTPITARQRAAELLEQVRRKIDPFDAERAAVVQAKLIKEQDAAAKVIADRLAFDAIAARYIKSAKGKIKTWREYESVIERDLKPEFGQRPLPSLTPADIQELLDAIGERGETASLRAYNVLRALFVFAAEKEKRHFKAAQSPMLEISRPGTIKHRERHLADQELALVWQCAGGLGWPFTPVIRLLILTGQRLREVAHMPWTELNMSAREWIIPGARTKNGRPTLVPITDSVLAIVNDLPRIKNDGNLVFPSGSLTPLTAFSKMKARLDASMLVKMKEAVGEAGDDSADTKLADWRLHDLRRTLAVGCQRMGIAAEVTEELLNHKSGTRSGIVGVYQVYDFKDEKTAALAAWDRRVAAIVSGQPTPSNVVELAERRA